MQHFEDIQGVICSIIQIGMEYKDLYTIQIELKEFISNELNDDNLEEAYIYFQVKDLLFVNDIIFNLIIDKYNRIELTNQNLNIIFEFLVKNNLFESDNIIDNLLKKRFISDRKNLKGICIDYFVKYMDLKDINEIEIFNYSTISELKDEIIYKKILTIIRSIILFDYRKKLVNTALYKIKKNDTELKNKIINNDIINEIQTIDKIEYQIEYLPEIKLKNIIKELLSNLKSF